MQQAVLSQFPNIQASYRFTNRNKAALFSRQSIERFRTAISGPLILLFVIVPTNQSLS